MLALSYINQPLFINNGVGVEYFGVILLVTNLLNMFMGLLSPIVKKHVGVNLSIFLGTLIPGIFILFICKATSAVMIIAFFIVAGAISQITSPAYKMLFNDNISSDNRATILSMISFIGSIVGMVIKPLIGIVADLGIDKILFLVGVVLIMMSFLLVCLLLKVAEGNNKKENIENVG